MKRGAMEEPATLASLSKDCSAAILALVPLRDGYAQRTGCTPLILLPPPPPAAAAATRPAHASTTACRLASCALVCKRWHGLVTAEPRLLRSLDLELSNSSGSKRSRGDPAADAERRLRSLLRFLSAAAPHVRDLSLRLDAPRHYRPAQARQLAAELQASLGRCTQLERLSLDLCDVPCTLGPWLAPLAGRLRHVHVEYLATRILLGEERVLRLQPGGLAACARVETLVLNADNGLDVHSAGCWPQGLTSLELHLPFSRDLPAPVSF